MSNEFKKEDTQSILDQLQAFLATDHTQEEEQALGDETRPHGAKFLFDQTHLFETKILPLVKQLMEICQAADIPLMVTTISSVTDEGMNSHNFMNMPFPICEFIAMRELLTMPHEFTHLVINQAAMLQALNGIMGGDDEQE